jgi:uncharacterized protein (TIGR02611 family)
MTTTIEPKPHEHSAPPAPLRTLLPMPWAIWFWNQSRKIVILVSGMAVLLAGVVMLVIPGPGLLGIVAGLAILATEFAWARWMLKYAKERAAQLMEAAKAQLNGNTRQ